MSDPFNFSQNPSVDVIVGGRRMQYDMSGIEPDHIASVKAEFDGTEWAVEQDFTNILGFAGLIQGNYAAMSEQTYYPGVHQNTVNEVNSVFPFANKVQGQNIIDVFGLQDCTEELSEDIKKAQNTADLEMQYLNFAQKNVARFYELAKRGEVFG